MSFGYLPAVSALTSRQTCFGYKPDDGGHGHVVTGNVGNLLAGARWDPTDAVMSFPLEPAAADALRKWFDYLHAHSRPLTRETAAAPRLRPPEGDAEGERLWREYLEVLDRRRP